MQISTGLVALTTVLGLAPSTVAFLITSDIADAAAQAKDAFKTFAFGRTHSIDVACQDCPFFVDEQRDAQGRVLTQVGLIDVPNSIHLEITANENGLQINNATVYPFKAIGPPVYAHQTRLDDATQGIEVPVDFAAAVRPAVRDDTKTLAYKDGEDMHELVPVDFAVIAMSAVPVTAQSIHIDLMYNLVDSTYEIVGVKESDFEPAIRADPCAGQSAYSACRLRHSMEQQLEEILTTAKDRAHATKEWLKTDPLRSVGRPCHGKHGDFKDAQGGPRHHIKGGPKHMGNHDGYHGHHRSKAVRALRTIHHVIHFVVIPALLGVAGGLAAGALGMLVGQTVAYCWARFGRGGRRGAVANARVYEIEIIADEKEGLLVTDEEELPRYHDVDVEAEAEADAKA